MAPLVRRSLLVMTLLAGVATGAHAADVGVSVRLGEPGFFGQVDIGGAPPPQLIFTDPVVVAGPRQGPLPPPVYLHVPPGQERHWKRYCRQYGACDRPVYFVRDAWYRDVYVPHYRDHFGRDGHRDEPHDYRRDDHRDEHRDDHHDDRRDDDRRDHDDSRDH